MNRRLVTGFVWLLGLGVAALALRWAGRGPLATPPLSDPGRWKAWLDGRDPLVAAFSLLRLVALAGLWYVVTVRAVGATVRMVGATSLVRVTDRFTIAPVRRLLAGTMSLGLAASGVVAVAAPAIRTPVAAAAQEATTSTTTPSSTVTMHLLAPAEAVPAAPVPAPDVAPASTDRWTVKSGECFWSIAESVLSEPWGRAPTDAEIVPYWQRLIDANRHELADGNDPDLILPGQVFVVPAP